MRLDNDSFAAKNTESSKDPRYTIIVYFDDTVSPQDLHCFTSHADAAILPGSTSTVSTIEGISGTSQKLNPDKGLASIGTISITLTDLASSVSTLFNTKLDIGSGLRGKTLEVYTSFINEPWSKYVLIGTQIVDSVESNKDSYILKLADIQRSERKTIFDLATTTMSASITDTDYLIPAYSVTGFETLEHGTSYSDAPSIYSSSPQVIKDVLYIKVDDEIIRCTGTSGLNFVVDNDGASPITATGRGALNTKAVAHIVDNSLSDNSRKKKITEYVYLEMPILKLIYAILTGNLEGQPGKTLPSKWHLNIPLQFVKLTDFTDVSNIDLWDTTDDTAGVIGYFAGIKKQDAKKFIETELNLLLGIYNPVYADGSLGLKRMSGILAGSSYVKELNESNVTGYSALKHDMRSVLNSFEINWNWNTTTDEFTRTTILLDTLSIGTHGEGKLKILNFRGLDGARHTEETIFNLFNSLRDRYSGPPLRITVNCLPSLNVLEVGDIVRVTLPNVRDFNGALAPLDRSFEIQGININWITGQISLNLFGSSQSAGALALGGSSSVLNDAFYIAEGTELKTYIDGLGSPSAFTVTSGIGHITGDITIAGSTPATIYYYDAPLTIDSGVIVTVTGTVELRIKGHLTKNGDVDGIGQGLAAVAGTSTYFLGTQPPGISGGIGNTWAWGGQHLEDRRYHIGGGQYVVDSYITGYDRVQALGNYDIMPQFNITNTKATNSLTGVPTNLSGSSGGAGGNYTYSVRGGGNGVLAVGGAGGAGGAGLITISRGCTIGQAGSVNLSGSPGVKGTSGTYSAGNTHYSGTGSGGSGGGWLILIDGATSTTPDTDKIKTVHGSSEASGPLRWPSSGPINNYAAGGENGPHDPFFTGYQDNSLTSSYFRIQYIPEDIAAVADTPIQTVIPPTTLNLESGDTELFVTNDGTVISRLKASWAGSIDQNLGGYEVEYKFTADALWTTAGNTINLETNYVYIQPVQDGANYDVRVRAINNIRVRSNWLTILSYKVIGKLAPPPDCSSFTVQRLADGTRVFDGGILSINRPVDFAGYEIRAAVGSGLAWSALTPLHTGLITQLPFETNQLAAGNYTAGIKVIDTTGNESVNALLVDSTLGDPRIKNALYTADFHADGWPGTKTNCYVDASFGDLIATDQHTWANFPTVSPIIIWAPWNTWSVNPNSPITYETLAIDLGAILDVTPLVSAASNGTTVLLEESHSDDDITYSAYAAAGSQVNARYIKIKLTITNATTAAIITAASVIMDTPIIDEYIQDVNTNTLSAASPRVIGDIRLPIVKTYSTIKNVQIALQNVGGGWSWELIDKNTAGPRIKIYNSSNVLSDAVIDAYISGA